MSISYIGVDIIYNMGKLTIEDIKELGFEESWDEPGEWFHAYKGDHNTQLYYDDKIESPNRGVGITIYKEDGNQHLVNKVFSGWLNSKEELEKLIFQLDLSEEWR